MPGDHKALNMALSEYASYMFQKLQIDVLNNDTVQFDRFHSQKPIILTVGIFGPKEPRNGCNAVSKEVKSWNFRFS